MLGGRAMMLGMSGPIGMQRKMGMIHSQIAQMSMDRNWEILLGLVQD